MYKVVLWGAGTGYNIFTSRGGHSMVDVVAITDSVLGSVYKKIDGIPVIKPEELLHVLFDYLIILTDDDELYKKIIIAVENLGVKRDVILPLRILEMRFLILMNA